MRHLFIATGEWWWTTHKPAKDIETLPEGQGGIPRFLRRRSDTKRPKWGSHLSVPTPLPLGNADPGLEVKEKPVPREMGGTALRDAARRRQCVDRPAAQHRRHGCDRRGSEIDIDAEGLLDRLRQLHHAIGPPANRPSDTAT